MSVIFDAHAHCFPPLGLDRGDKQYYDMCLAEHQYHVRFHPQGVRRSSDSSLISMQKQNSILTGEHDGVSWLPDISFRIGEFGRLEFTHEEQDYYMPMDASFFNQYGKFSGTFNCTNGIRRCR